MLQIKAGTKIRVSLGTVLAEPQLSLVVIFNLHKLHRSLMLPTFFA